MGDPLERPAEKVLADMRQGHVSVDSAKTEYGVALTPGNSEWRVDEEATRVLRENEKKAGKKNFPLL
jgi:N-methylhydantoinase B